MKNSNMTKLKNIFYASIFVMSVVFVGSFGNVPRASAVEPGNCYKKNNGQLEKITCPDGVKPSQTQCFLSEEVLNISDLLFVIDCETGEMLGNAKSSGGHGSSSGELEGGDCNDAVLTGDNCNIVKYLVGGIQFLSALAGMAIVGSMMMAGYQYMTARDNSGQVEAAKKRILWALIALGLFIFMFAILNWLVPGGVL